ncbi:MAG: hypothetical protein ACE5IY_07635 [bacterium]
MSKRNESRRELRATDAIIEYDIHGLVGIRLVNPTEKDAAAVARQLGPLRGDLVREPDIIVRFVRHLPLDDLHYLGLNKVGYDQNGFYILRSSKKDVRVRLAFDQIGERVEILCQSGVKSVPHLLAILNLMLLKKDVVALHASAFVFDGTGIIVTGWAKGGKTEALLSFAAHGGEYVGDEWIYLSADGERMYGIPENIRLWDWHLDNLPHLKGKLNFEKKALFGTVHALDRMQRRLPEAGLGNAMPLKFLREAMPALRRQLNVQLPPQVIFEKCSETFSARPDRVFMLISHAGPEYSVEPVEASEIARRMIASLQFELMPFMESYTAFKFAFPEKASEFVETAHEWQSEILSRALENKQAYVVKHPYPLSFEALYDAMRPFCQVRSNGTAAEDTQNQRLVAN